MNYLKEKYLSLTIRVSRLKDEMKDMLKDKKGQRGWTFVEYLFGAISYNGFALVSDTLKVPSYNSKLDLLTRPIKFVSNTAN